MTCVQFLATCEDQHLPAATLQPFPSPTLPQCPFCAKRASSVYSGTQGWVLPGCHGATPLELHKMLGARIAFDVNFLNF